MIIKLLWLKLIAKMYNGKSRYLGVKYSLVHELFTHGVIAIEFVRSQNNLADNLTKELDKGLVKSRLKGCN